MEEKAPALRHYKLCDLHFESSQFKNASTRNSLNWKAIPSLLDVPNPPCMVIPKRHPPTMRETTPEKLRKVESTATAESQDDVPEPETPRKQKLKAANRRLRTVCRLAEKTSRQRKLRMTKEEE
ncbi:hypothetical protein LSAT2_018346 [Lamellibrachia satsuma]|nr:hypothetical protein LSAT2_018346 [Lamellibrachia satsuma]